MEVSDGTPGGTRTRNSASRRLLEQHVAILGGGIGPSTGAHWPPSRRREEAQALENLQKRVTQGLSQKALIEGPSGSSTIFKPPKLDNRPQLLQKSRNQVWRAPGKIFGRATLSPAPFRRPVLR
ncbi:hypothetical protein J6590_057752 [Homalodisca vitripennis]|nr:hypothetical protein J6590_057752 [Homalodisca vitripennis]